ncbi:MAG: hypothetical protein EWM72_02040 [Nitrospira sp.]|nr:MAG: hypothetical protein EWM72_02040 [Nitrospira sp.]
MAQRIDVSGQVGSTSQQTEVSEVSMETQTVRDTSKVMPANTCSHQRLIDEVLTRDGERTGKVRCLECGAVFADPYWGVK